MTTDYFIGFDGISRKVLSVNNKLGLLFGKGTNGLLYGIYYQVNKNDGSVKQFNVLMMSKMKLNIMLIQKEIGNEQ